MESTPNGPARCEALTGHDGESRRVATSRDRRAQLATTLAVGLGGLLGSNARYQLGLWAAERWGTAFPWGTLVINVTGSFAIGFYLTIVSNRSAGRPITRLFIATGFLGGYTTFSTFSFDAVQLVRDGELAAAVGYVLASLGLGLAATVMGSISARNL